MGTVIDLALLGIKLSPRFCRYNDHPHPVYSCYFFLGGGGDTFLEAEMLSQRVGIFLKLSDKNQQTTLQKVLTNFFHSPPHPRWWVGTIVSTHPHHTQVTAYTETRYQCLWNMTQLYPSISKARIIFCLHVLSSEGRIIKSLIIIVVLSFFKIYITFFSIHLDFVLKCILI